MQDLFTLPIFDRSLALIKAMESTATTVLFCYSTAVLPSVPIAMPSIPIAMPVYTFELPRRMSTQTAEISTMNERRAYAPKTPLGKKLMAIRERAIASGLRLLTEDEISDEIRRRRGEPV